MKNLALFGLFAAGCSDYDLIGKGHGPEVPEPFEDSVEDPVEDPTPPPEIAQEEEAPPPPVPSCADAVLPALAWVASAPFDHLEDPPSAGGAPFYMPGADLQWAPVVLPDRDIPVGDDRAYVAELELDTVPVNLSLNLQSDDGLWVWVNGEYVGNWGGAWQEEGCVNENAECLVTSDVPPIDVTDLLQPGTNVIAARVSNPVANSYFEIIPECVD